MFHPWGSVCTLVTFLFSFLNWVGDKPFEKTAPVANVNKLEELLLSGKYRDIPLGNDAASKAIWAFATYYLAPNKKVYDAAWEAHQKGDLLGTFIVMRCHEEGRAVRRDENLFHQLNFNLRDTLSKKDKCSPVELFILSQTSNANGEGVVDLSKVKDPTKFQKEDQERVESWLLRAAQQGFAQASNDLGKHFQKNEEYRKAWKWYDQAAKKGLAEAWRAKGFFFMEGLGVPKNQEEGFAATLEAAEHGDAFAMVSMATYLENGWGTKKNQKQAVAWIEKAKHTGHWIGFMELAQIRLQGAYGIKKNEKEALACMRQAIQTRNRDVLEILTSWYVKGTGVTPDGHKAVLFGEAAFVQGSKGVARYLAFVYKEGIGGVEKNEKLARYWTVQSDPNISFTLADGLGKQYPELTDHLRKLDPWELK